MPAPAARRLREPDRSRQGSFAQPQRHLLLSRINAGSEVPGQISTHFSQRGSSPECGFCWKPHGVFLLENIFSRRGSFDAHTRSTARSSYTPGWSLLSPHPGVPLPGPSGPDSRIPYAGGAKEPGAAGAGGDGRLSHGNSPATGQQARESCCYQHPQSVGLPRSCEMPGNSVEKGLAKAQLAPAPGQPSCSIRKALNIRETIQTSQEGAMSKAPAVWGPSTEQTPVLVWHQQISPMPPIFRVTEEAIK